MLITKLHIERISLTPDTRVSLTFPERHNLTIALCIERFGPIRLKGLVLTRPKDGVLVPITIQAPPALYMSTIPKDFLPYWEAAERLEGTWLLHWKAAMVARETTTELRLKREKDLRTLKRVHLI